MLCFSLLYERKQAQVLQRIEVRGGREKRKKRVNEEGSLEWLSGNSAEVSRIQT